VCVCGADHLQRPEGCCWCAPTQRGRACLSSEMTVGLGVVGRFNGQLRGSRSEPVDDRAWQGRKNHPVVKNHPVIQNHPAIKNHPVTANHPVVVHQGCNGATLR
ncbi:unnamed protein product, partial [Discosporangium mesarthrocarpum]